jgi:hypothetical protein
MPLEALRLTVPAGAHDGAAGVPHHKLNLILKGQRSLTTLVADVYTDQVTAPGENSVSDGLISLYGTIATSTTLQKVDLRTTTAVKLPIDQIEELTDSLNSNFLLYEFKPLQDDSSGIKSIIERNRRLHTELLNVASNQSEVDKVLSRIDDAGTREQLQRLVVDVANRPTNLPSIIPDDRTERSEVESEHDNRSSDVVIRMPKVNESSSSSDAE